MATVRDLAPDWYVLLSPLTDNAVGTGAILRQSCGLTIASDCKRRGIVEGRVKALHRAVARFFQDSPGHRIRISRIAGPQIGNHNGGQ